MFHCKGSFSSDSVAVVAHDQSVYTVEPGKIQVRNFQVSFLTTADNFFFSSVKYYVVSWKYPRNVNFIDNTHNDSFLRQLLWTNSF